MGFSTSLIIIENPDDLTDDISILNHIGKGNYEFRREASFEACLYPKDKSICIGYYGNKIIIFDDYQLTTQSLDRAENLALIDYEQKLVELFPKSEILTIACHSVVNYHGYSVIQNSRKIRLKTISSESDLLDFGDKLVEEEEIYKNSHQKGDASFWKYDALPDEVFSEDQLLEEFVYSMIEKGLGFYLDDDHYFEIAENIRLKKYYKVRKGLLETLFGRRKHQKFGQ